MYASGAPNGHAKVSFYGTWLKTNFLDFLQTVFVFDFSLLSS